MDEVDRHEFVVQRTEIERLRSEVASLRAQLDVASDRDRLVKQLREQAIELREGRRTTRLNQALREAVLALAQSDGSTDAFFAAASDALVARDMRTARWEVDPNGTITVRDVRVARTVWDHLDHLVPDARIIGFSSSLPRIDAFRKAYETGEAVFVDDPGTLLDQIYGERFRWLTPIVLRAVRMNHTVVVPVRHRYRTSELFVVMSDDLRPQDTAILTAFGLMMSAAAERGRLTSELQSNLSSLRQMQDQLVQGQKMRAVGQLAGGIAHDFNNLLTAIVGSTELLEEEVGALPEVRTELDTLRTASDRATSLVRQLLLFARPAAEQPQASELNQTLRRLEPLLARALHESHELRLEPTEEPLHVAVDASRLEQVLMNFTINARDAMPTGGVLTIRTGRRRGAVAESGSFLYVQVADTGVGMTAEQRSRMFEPFYTTKTGEQGTGLGLSVVYGIVDQAQGWLEVESSPGRGTTITACFPPGRPEPRVVTPPADDQAAVPANILVVDDEVAILALVERSLTRRGHAVRHAASIAEATAVIRSSGVDLALCDVRLPDGSGIDLVDELQRRGISVILSSGHLDPRSGEAAVRDRGLPFLRKPYTVRQLVRRVNEQLAARRV